MIDDTRTPNKEKRHCRFFLKKYLGEKLKIKGRYEGIVEPFGGIKKVLIKDAVVNDIPIDHFFINYSKRWREEKLKCGEVVEFTATVVEYNSECFTYKKYTFASARAIVNTTKDIQWNGNQNHHQQ